MTLNEIRKACVNHCWTESYKRQIKAYENRLKAINAMSEDDSSFGSFSKKEQLYLFKRRLSDAKVYLQHEEDMQKHGLHRERHCSCVNNFKRLDPNKGYLRLLRTIKFFNEHGKKPFRYEATSYITIKYGCTYKENEVFASLHLMGLVEFDKGFYITQLGEELLKAKGCNG